MGDDHNDPYTIAAVRIKRKNKKMLGELFHLLLITLILCAFFTACWVVDRFANGD